MKNKFIKRLASIVALLMLTGQISLPAYAVTDDTSASDDTAVTTAAESNDDSTMEDSSDANGTEDTEMSDSSDDSTMSDSGSDDSMEKEEDVSLSEEVDEDNVVDVLSSDTEDVSENQGDDLAEQASDDVLKDLEGKSDDELAASLKGIEDDIANEIQNLEKEAEKNPALRLKIQKRIMHLKALRTKLRVKLLKKHVNLVKKIKKATEARKIYEIRWGNLTGKRERCKGLTLNDLRTALSNRRNADGAETEDGDREIPEKCQDQENRVEYSGKISVDKGTLKVHKKVLFEKNDSVTTESGSSIAFDSVIAGHWDGLIVEYMPEEGQEEKVNVTVSIGDLDKTYVGAEVLGRKRIGNNHMIEIKNLGQALNSLAKNAKDKLVEYKVKIQDKANKLRDKIDRFRLLNKGGEGADELEEAVDEAGEYNFDDETSAEVQTAIDSAVSALGDGASKEEIKKRAEQLREHLKNLKEKAKSLKFTKKLIPFKDTDDDQWYTGYVSTVKNKGIISGYKDANGNDLGEFRPGNNITVAEILKIGLETAGKGKKKDGKPTLQAAANHWAKEYVAEGEDLGLDLVKSDTDLNRPATRAEVVRMMLEALGVNPDDITKTSFSDLSKLHKDAKFIEYAKELGIISGDAGKNTFRPDDPINRAEAAKISNQILETLVGDTE